MLINKDGFVLKITDLEIHYFFYFKNILDKIYPINRLYMFFLRDFV